MSNIKSSNGSRVQFGLLLSVISYNLFVFRKQIYSLLNGNFSPIFEFKQDATLFVSQMMLGIHNLPFNMNPFWGELGDNHQVGRNYPIYLLGRIAGIANLDLTTTLLFGVLVISSLFILSMHQIQYIFIGRKKFGPLLTLLVCVLLFGDLAQRPSPTQWSLPLLIFSIVLMIKVIEKTIFWNHIVIGLAVSVLLVIFNPFYSIFFILFTLVSSFGKIARLAYRLIFIFVSLAGALVTGMVVESKIKTSSNFEVIERWGLLFSHFPGSLRTTCLLITLILINIAMRRKDSQNSLQNIVIQISISTIFTMQQNLITGIWWEPESHYYYLASLCIFLTLMNIIQELEFKRISQSQSGIKLILLSVLILGLFLSNIQSNDAFSRTSYGQNLLQNKSMREIQEVLEKETIKKDLIATPLNLSNEITWAGLMSNRRFLWDYQGSLLSGNDSEILIRYMCNLRENFDSETEVPSLYLTQGHRILNANQHFNRWIFLSRWIPSLENKSTVALEYSESRRVESLMPFDFSEECSGEKSIEATKILTIEQGKPVIRAAN